MAPPVLTNLRTVSAAWRDEWTGVLVVETPGLGGGSRVQIRAGGLVEVGQSRRLARGITVGVVSFEPCSVAGRGDRSLLGRVLTAVSRVLSERIRGTLPSEAVVELAMPPERLAGCVAPALVDRLLGRKAVVGALLRDGTATVQELRALGWLGVVRLQKTRRPRSKRSMMLPEAEALQPTPPTELALPTVPAAARPAPAAEDGPADLDLQALEPLAEEDLAQPGGEVVEGEDDQTEESLVVPQVDPRPIPLPPLELQVTAGAEVDSPIVHLGLFEPLFDACEVPRQAGIAFGEEQRADDLPASLRTGRDQDVAALSEDALWSGLDDELDEVLPQDELGLLLGLPGAVARARAREAAPRETGAAKGGGPEGQDAPGWPPTDVVATTASGVAPARPPRGEAPRIEVPRVEVDLREAMIAARGYNLGHLVDPCQIRAEGGTRRRRVGVRGHR